MPERVTKGESVASILTIAINKGKRPGPARSKSTGKQERKGLKLKWCPVKDCQKVTHLQRSYLSKFHNITAGFIMERDLFMAREYKGKAEVKQMKKEMREGKRKHREQPTKPSATITSSTLDKETAPMEITSGPSTSQAEDPEQPPSPSPILIPTDVPSEEEDNEEDESHYPDWKGFFDDPNPKSNRHRWLVLFYHHLNRPDCRRKKQKNGLQHADNVRRILEDLQPRGSDIDILSEDEDYIVWTHWVDPNTENLGSGTIRSYLGSYQAFPDLSPWNGCGRHRPRGRSRCPPNLPEGN